jgi:hypothetical protein
LCVIAHHPKCPAQSAAIRETFACRFVNSWSMQASSQLQGWRGG